MKIQGKFTVIDKQEKSGTKDGKDWSMTEYVLKATEERDDGSELTTVIPATASKMVDALEAGATYNATLFIASRSFTGDDNKERHFVSFRITKAEKIAGQQESVAKKDEVEVAESVSDDIPF